MFFDLIVLALTHKKGSIMKKIKILTIIAAFSLSAFSQNARTTIEITAATQTASSYTDKEIVINGKSDLHITATTSPLTNSIVKLNSVDSWLFFDNLRPQYVIDNLLQYVSVNNQAAVNKTNCRVAIYAHGTVIMPYPSNFKPLEAFTEQNFSGESYSYEPQTYYKGLGVMENKIRSFRLKRGYMVTLANNSDGTGYSRVFIADKSDLEIGIISNLLDKTISFIRVFPWEYVTKKGWCGTGSAGGTDVEKVAGTWWYSWSADQNSKTNQEYVPIKQNLGWPGWTEINTKQNVSHLLGFNEPNRPDQSNMSVAQAVAAWPEYLKSGLRLGSPSPSDPFGSNGKWLYDFLDSCKARNYRVDYVAIHCYWAKSPQQWYNDLKWVHERTGLPIWITEWNNGANWTTETSWPTADRSYSDANANKQYNDIKAILNVLDTASFVERYSIYNWVQDARAMILNGNLTKAGQYYMENKSVMAYNPKKEVIPTYTFKNPASSVSFGTKTLTFSISDPNGDYYNGNIIERKIDDNAYEVINDATNTSVKTFSDNIDLTNVKKVRYRARVRYTNGNVSAYTNESGYDVTNGEDVQYGNLNFQNVGWNSVFFNKPYTAIPSIILGAPTNANSTVYMSARAKLVSYSSRFNVQLAPWAYQNISTLSKEEKVPYFIAAPGSYDFGGIKAQANKATIGTAWTTVTFATAFSTIPVVFTTQLNPLTTFATTVRVRNVTTTGFEAKIQKESAVTNTMSNESVSFFAIEPGTGKINDKKIIVGKTAADAVSTTSYTTINYGDSIASPVFIAQMQTCNDDTVTATIRTLAVSEKFANVMKQRERSAGVTIAGKESAGWMVLQSQSILQGLNDVEYKQLSFYPNPVKDMLYLNQKVAESTNFDIYNLYGVLLRRVSTTNNTIDVSDLAPGSYIVRSKKLGTSKFIKL